MFFYGSIGAEILRIARATLTFENFIQSVKPFISRMQLQGSRDKKAKEIINKVINVNKDQFEKYSKSNKQIIDSIFPYA